MEIIISPYAPQSGPVKGLAVYGVSASGSRRWFAGLAIGTDVRTDLRDHAGRLRDAVTRGPGRHRIGADVWEVEDAVLAPQNIKIIGRGETQVWVSSGDDLHVVNRDCLAGFLLAYQPPKRKLAGPSLDTWIVLPPHCRNGGCSMRSVELLAARFCRMPSGKIVRLRNCFSPEYGRIQQRGMSPLESTARESEELAIGFHHWRMHILLERNEPAALYSPGLFYSTLPGLVHRATKPMLTAACVQAAVYGDSSGLTRFEAYLLN